MLSMAVAIKSFAAIEQSGVVKLQGEIYSATCTIMLNEQLLTNGSPIVNMGRHSTGQFEKVGSIVTGGSGIGEMKIVAEDCPDNGNIDVTFSGIANKIDKALLAIDIGEATAENVGIALYQGKLVSPKMRLELNQAYPYVVTSRKSYTMDFLAAYISTADTVIAGIANGTLNVDITYK